MSPAKKVGDKASQTPLLGKVREEQPQRAEVAPLTELGQYLFISSLMAMSFLCSFGPVWYHPTILSLAEQKQKRFGVRTRGRPQQRDLGREWVG